MKLSTLTAFIGGLLAATAAASAQSLAFTEGFNGLSDGVVITSGNTGLAYIKTTTQATYTGSLTAGSGGLVLESSGYGSPANYVGVGKNFGEGSLSAIWTISMDIGSDTWTSGTHLNIGIGKTSNGADQVYNDSVTTLSTNGANDAAIGAQSLFGLKITGSAAESGGYLRTIGSTGTLTNLKDGDQNNVVLKNGETYNLRIIANGSDSAIEVGGQSIASGFMGIWLDDIYVASGAIADSVGGTAFRILAAGNSSGNGQLTTTIDNIQVWNAAVAPIPEGTSFSAILGLSLLGLAVASRKHRR